MSSSRQIVFIPGWGFRPSIAKDFLPAFTQLINLPSLKGSYTIEALCQPMEEKIQPKDAILMGWSLGGLIAINLYTRHPNCYKALILMTTTPCFWAQSNWPGISREHQTIFMNNLNRDYRIFSAYYLKLLSEPFPPRRFSPNLYPHLIQETDFNDFKSYHNILFHADLRPEFSKIQIPTLIIQGGRDAIIPTRITPYLLRLNPSLNYYTIPDAGHIPFVTHQNESTKVLTKFLKEFS